MGGEMLSSGRTETVGVAIANEANHSCDTLERFLDCVVSTVNFPTLGIQMDSQMTEFRRLDVKCWVSSSMFSGLIPFVFCQRSGISLYHSTNILNQKE